MRLWLVLLLILCALAGPARGFVEFQKAFVNEYIAEHQDKDFAKFVKSKAKCWICHQGKKKENLNTYGVLVGELAGKDDKKDVEKILSALREVAAKPVDPQAEKKQTYGERIAASLLPAGKLDDLKKEPTGAAGN